MSLHQSQSHLELSLQSLVPSVLSRISNQSCLLTRRSPSSHKACNTVNQKLPLIDDFRINDDWGGFGRRTSATFGYPPQRNNDPHEDPLEEKKHYHGMANEKSKKWQR